MSDVITVFSAEFMRRLRSRPFLFGVAIGVLVLVFIIRAPAIFSGFGGGSVYLSGDPALVKRAAPLLKNQYRHLKLAGAQTPAQLIAQEKAQDVIVLARSGKGLAVRVYAKNPADVEASTIGRALAPLNIALYYPQLANIESLERVPVTVSPIASKFGDVASAQGAQSVAFVLIFLLYLVTIMNSQLLMSSVAEEKTSRVAELLVASIDPSALLTGKILAAAALAFVQLFAWGATAVYLSAGSNSGAAGPSPFAMSASSIEPAIIIAFALFFLIGLLQYATLFAAVASLVSRVEDLGSMAMPLVFPIIIAFFIAQLAMSNPTNPVAVISSFIPLFAPFTMFARIAMSAVPVWQIALSIVINLLAVWGLSVFAGKIYRVGMLLYGRPPKVGQILATMRLS